MKLFLDSANIEDIRKYGYFIEGITTNPAIMAKEGVTQEQRLKEICGIMSLPVSGEVVYDTSVSQIVEDAIKLSRIASNLVVKIPGSLIGMKAIHHLAGYAMKLNITALMTAHQLSLAAMLGAEYASIFFCRSRDTGLNPSDEINKAKDFMNQHGLTKTKIIVGSLRTIADVEEALNTKADILTIPPALFQETLDTLFSHPRTRESIDEFAEKYENATKS